jgi:serine/threonine protein kinase
VNEENLFHLALEKPAGERAAFLEHACGGDADVRRRLEVLLQAHENPGSFLEKPALNQGTTGDPLPARHEDQDGPRLLRNGPGSRIGPYKLLQQIGEGGMGTVFLAEQTHPVRRNVALKVIKPGLDSRQVLARFEVERQALALMDHPNIAKVLDAGTTESDQPHFVMELVKGVPITKYCDEHRLTPKERLELFVPVCQAVQHAHQKGVIHRDLKPTNVLIALYDGRPVPKVIDFGVAKAAGPKLTERTLFTEFGALVGTLEYMSPEQAELNQLDIDTRSDIYALGVLLYELLTGTTPLERKRVEEAGLLESLRIIREEETQRPSTRLSTLENLPLIAANRGLEPKKLRGLVRGELDWIVLKALEKERDRRYETANGLARDFMRYLADEPVEACPPSAGYKLRKLARRHRKALTVAAAFALLLVLGVVISTWEAVRATLAEEEAVTARDAETRERKHAEQQRTQAEQHRKRAEGAERLARQRLEQVTAEKQRVDAERAVAQAVNGFLQHDLLGLPDVFGQPGDGLGRESYVKIGKLLDKATQQLKGKFADQPLTEAAIRQMVGEAYRTLGRYGDAEPHLKRAVELRTAKLGPDDPDTLTSKHLLALLYYQQGKYGPAERLYRKVLRARAAKLGPNDPQTLTTKDNLGALYLAREKYDQAEPLIREALRGRADTLGPNDRNTLTSKNNLAALYSAQRKYALAEPLLQEVLRAREAAQGPDHTDTVHAKYNLAVLYYNRGKYDRAEPLFREALRAYAATFGPDNRDTLKSKNCLAVLYRTQRKYALAEPLFQEVVRRHTATLGPNHTDTLTSKNGLAKMYREQRKYALAEPLFQEVVRGRAATLGPNHEDTLTSKNNLSELYNVQGKYALAEPLILEVVRGRAATQGPDHTDTVHAKRNLAVLYYNQAKYDQAEPLFGEVLRAQAAQLGPDDPQTLNSRNNLAKVYHSQGKYDRAEPLLREAVQRARKVLRFAHQDTQLYVGNFCDCCERMGHPARAEPLRRELAEFWKAKAGSDSPLYAAHLAALGWNLLGQQKYAEAERVLRPCLAIRAKKLPDNWLTYNVRSLLGGALVGLKKYPEAEPLLVEGYEGMKQRAAKIPPAGHPRLTEALERLVQLYIAWDKKDKAAQWQKKLEAHKETLKKQEKKQK